MDGLGSISGRWDALLLKSTPHHLLQDTEKTVPVAKPAAAWRWSLAPHKICVQVLHICACLTTSSHSSHLHLHYSIWTYITPSVSLTSVTTLPRAGEFKSARPSPAGPQSTVMCTVAEGRTVSHARLHLSTSQQYLQFVITIEVVTSCDVRVPRSVTCSCNLRGPQILLFFSPN